MTPSGPHQYMATAYGPPWNAMNGGGVTSKGVNLTTGKQLLAIAVDPSLIPYGTKMKFTPNPFGDASLVFTACDTGGAIIGYHIDFFIASGRQAQNGWGVRNVTGTVVGSGSPTDVAIIGTPGATQTPPGGTSGAGGTGASTNDILAGSSPFTVGDSSSPNEDYWTAINRLSQTRYWYSFSNAEILYLADGPDLMAQKPVFTIDRLRDADKINHLEFTFDNTAFSYTTTHRRRRHTNRKTSLAKVQSPVEAQLNYICKIDDVRAGDVIILSGCGPGDGRWLVGDVRRSVFQVFSEITLVQALQPLKESDLQTTGIAGINQNKPSDAGTSFVSGSAKPNIPDLGTTLPPISTMIKYFGPLASSANETNVDFAGHSVQINKVLAANVQAMGQAVQSAGLASQIHDIGGFRTSVGASGSPIPFSMHQFGAAIDVNESSQNWNTMTLDPKLVAIFKQFGWFCGESWGGGSRDGGHFQFQGGL